MTTEMEKWAGNQNAIAPVIGLFWLIFAITIGIWLFSGDGCIEQHIAESCAEDYEVQYQIALRNGEYEDARTAASLAAMFYLHAHDDYNHKKWKNRERNMDICIEKQKRGVESEIGRRSSAIYLYEK